MRKPKKVNLNTMYPVKLYIAFVNQLDESSDVDDLIRSMNRLNGASDSQSIYAINNAITGGMAIFNGEEGDGRRVLLLMNDLYPIEVSLLAHEGVHFIRLVTDCIYGYNDDARLDEESSAYLMQEFMSGVIKFIKKERLQPEMR